MQSTPASTPPVDEPDEVDTADAPEDRELVDPPEVVDEFDEPAASEPLVTLP